MHIINEQTYLPVDQYLKLLLITTRGMGTSPKFARTNINLSLVELNHTLCSLKLGSQHIQANQEDRRVKALIAPHCREHHKAS